MSKTKPEFLEQDYVSSHHNCSQAPFGKVSSQISNADDTMYISETIRKFKPTGELTLSMNGSCACSTLAEEADWNAEYWSMEPRALILLENTVKRIAEHTPDGFSFEAIWSGDKIGKYQTVSLQEFIEIIRAGQIGTHTCYGVKVPSQGSN